MNLENVFNQIINGIKSIGINPTLDNPISTHEPFFKDTNATNYVNDCINTGWVSSTGKWVNIFEDKISKFTGAKHCVAVNNGTAALKLAYMLQELETNDEVIMPPLSFVATSNAVSHLGAYPHFVDVEKDTYGISSKALSTRLEKIGCFRDGELINKLTGRRISAVIAVHVFGNPANTSSLLEVTSKWNLPLIEDAAEALGSWNKSTSKRERTHCGLMGDIGILSFNGNKIITTGGGGAVITNDSYKANFIRHLSTTAKETSSLKFFHDQIAWNDRMPNLKCSIRCLSNGEH